MRKFKRFQPRALPFRSLLVVAGALLLMAALAPKANATELVYFNFEDATLGGPFDPAADLVGPPDFNPGGGIQASTLTTNLVTTAATAGTAVNRSVGDIDTINNLGMGMRTTTADNGHWVQFGVNASAFSNMSLSFAINTAGNGFDTVTFSYSTDGGTTFTTTTSVSVPSGGGFHAFSFSVPSAVNGQSNVVLRLTFTGGTSSGQNLETVIDNIQLTGVPEPATVAGGMLGVLGLCWHQRRRLIRSVRFRRA